MFATFGTLRKLFPKAQPPGTFTGAACLSPAKPGLPTAPQHSTSKARAPHSPPAQFPAQYQQSQGSQQSPAQYQRSQGSPQPPSTVPVKPGLPTAPQHSEACLPQPVICLTACLPHSLDLYSLDLYLLDIYTFIWKHSS